jgi:hypothetical protein
LSGEAWASAWVTLKRASQVICSTDRFLSSHLLGAQQAITTAF